jgi:hypothetical protein
MAATTQFFIDSTEVPDYTPTLNSGIEAGDGALVWIDCEVSGGIPVPLGRNDKMREADGQDR